MKKIVCEIAGGLGNQMFCYACGMAVARKCNSDFEIDVSRFSNDQFGRIFELSNFSISASIINFRRDNLINKVLRKIRILGYRVITEEKAAHASVDELIFKANKLYLDYNWHCQNFSLFHEIRKDIVNEFKYAHEYRQNYIKTATEIKEYFSVAIHLRFGDYVKIGCCIDESYYGEAVKQLSDRILPLVPNKEIALIIFSEDMKKAKVIIDKFAPDIKTVYIDKSKGLTDIEEFLLMKDCDAHVISNSTFSWWAAYLSEKRQDLVVAPLIEGWIKNEWEDGYFPDEWITVRAHLFNE